MSAKPSFATEMDESASGIDVPAASTVVPMTMAGIFSKQPILAHHSTMKCEMIPIQPMDAKKDPKYHFSHFGL